MNSHTVGIRNATDFSPFGVELKGRNFEVVGGGNYRYSFQGQESDSEVKGEGNSVNYSFRMHDPRLGRFFAVDPMVGKYSWYSPYQFSGNRVIDKIELEGLEESPILALDNSPESKVKNFAEIFKQRMEVSGAVMEFGIPNIVYNSEISAHAQYDNNTIKVNYGDAFYDGMSTDDDWLSTIRHEYEHYLDDKYGRTPLEMNENGSVKNTCEVDKEWSYIESCEEATAKLARWDRGYQQLVLELGEKEANVYLKQDPRPSGEPIEISKSRYIYTPSNLSLTELNSYRVQLESNSEGTFPMSESYQIEIESRVIIFERKYQMSIEYEKDNNLNTDGTPKF